MPFVFSPCPSRWWSDEKWPRGGSTGKLSPRQSHFLGIFMPWQDERREFAWLIVNLEIKKKKSEKSVEPSALTAVNINQAALRAKNFTTMHCTPSITSWFVTRLIIIIIIIIILFYLTNLRVSPIRTLWFIYCLFITLSVHHELQFNIKTTSSSFYGLIVDEVRSSKPTMNP